MFLVAASLFFSLVFLVFGLRRRKEKLPYPPGPPGDPIVGHLRRFTSTEGQEKYLHEISRTYGDIVHLRIPGQSIVVLNSEDAAIGLLDRRGSIYSSRPKFETLEIMGLMPYNLGFLAYGAPGFHDHRRIFQRYFSREQSLTYQPFVHDQARILLKQLFTNPSAWEHHLLHFVLAVPLKVGFDYDLKDNDEMLGVAHAAMNALNDLPIITAINYFPFLRYLPEWIPGTYYARYGRKHRPGVRKVFEYPFEVLVKKLQNGLPVGPCVVGLELENMGLEKLHDQEVVSSLSGIGGTIIMAGTDSVWSTLTTFIILMAMYPGVQRKVQAELDRVLGGDRLPHFSDHESLPIAPAFPLVIPRMTMEDDVCNGYFIPKGTIVIPNATEIGRDSRVYKDPEEFNPARFLPKPEGNAEPPYTALFGYGRRICPGRYLANSELFIAVASILSVFEINCAVGSGSVSENSKPELKFSPGLIQHPLPVACNIVPRSAVARRLIHD
ncbi:cytochrome P450 [Fistulina hepatica ATCC 64428]|uniref:Cytochrome P450 n=1 Tax=Fistulina hepatica ATCC 64428 TaxID=1128425 RepID=A0A0D7AFA6_9AGAR|nr:cytochrome P450 [Fistulina hepatica ATCC 64428]